MLALLGNPRVVDDSEGSARRVHLRHHPLGHALHHLRVRPVRLRHEVVQRLVARTRMQGSMRGAIGATLLCDSGSITTVQ